MANYKENLQNKCEHFYCCIKNKIIISIIQTISFIRIQLQKVMHKRVQIMEDVLYCWTMYMWVNLLLNIYA